MRRGRVTAWCPPGCFFLGSTAAGAFSSETWNVRSVFTSAVSGRSLYPGSRSTYASPSGPVFAASLASWISTGTTPRSLSSFLRNTCAPAGSASKRIVTVFLTGAGGGWGGGGFTAVVVVATGGGAGGGAFSLKKAKYPTASNAAPPPTAANSLVRFGLIASSSSISDDAEDRVDVVARDETVCAIVFADAFDSRRMPPGDAGGAVTLTSPTIAFR